MINKLKTLFNPDFIGEHTGFIEIEEEDKQAKVRYVRFENADFISLDKKMLDIMNESFKQKDDRFSLCKGCDGLFLLECSEEKYLFLIELKSNFTYDQITKARSQIEASYAKIIMLLNSLEGFHKEDYKYRALIISYEPTAETLTKLMKKTQVVPGYCKERFCLRLHHANDNGLILKHDISLLNGLPLKKDYKFDELPVYYVPYTGQTVDIRKYL